MMPLSGSHTRSIEKAIHALERCTPPMSGAARLTPTMGGVGSTSVPGVAMRVVRPAPLTAVMRMR